MTRVAPRSDVALMAGYHSPQLDVAVRLNTNEAPIAPPQEFLDAVAAAVTEVEWNRYPDRDATHLRIRLAEVEGVDPAQVFVANGSNEVLQTLLLAYGGHGRIALTFEPTYALHGHIARLVGTSVSEGERSQDFTLSADSVAGAIDGIRPDVTFLCSPNNPTGLVDPPEVTAAALEAVGRVPGLLIVDEAYGQFAPRSLVAEVSDDRPLVVTRTFSKTWSMAAARLGYAVAPEWVIEQLDKVVLPYHLDATKQAVGLAALDHVEAMRERVAALVSERERLVGRLGRLDVHVWPSGANFVLFRPNGRSGDDVWQALVQRGVLVRNCSAWPRLEDCLRVTIGTPIEDDTFLDVLTDILGAT